MQTRSRTTMRCLVFVAFVTIAAATEAPYIQSAAGNVKKNSYIIKLKDGFNAQQFAGTLQGQVPVDVKYIYKMSLNGLAIETLDLKSVLNFEEIEYVQDDMIVTPNVEWGMDRIDQRSLPLNGQMSLYGTGLGAHVYIVDTGLRHTHQEFGGRASYFWDFLPSNGGNDCHGHGTACGGIASGATVGVAPGSNLYSVRVLNCQGSGTTTDICGGLDAISSSGATPSRSVVSACFGGGGANTALDNCVQNTINYGYTMVVAAGNENQNACNVSPARLSAAITVAASDSSDWRASFSNYGSCVDLFAPGINVRTASHTCDTCYTTMSGTSMACAHVTGVVAVHLGAGSCNSNASCASRTVGDATSGVISDTVGSPNLLLYSA